MYTFDLYRDDRFMVCLGHYLTRKQAQDDCFRSFDAHYDKPENVGVRWQVRRHIYDGEGELDQTVVVAEYVAPA